MVSEPEPVPDSSPPADIDEDLVDDVPKPKPRKRKEKKVIPVGRNGFKKKRVVKSRMRVDEKGYMGMYCLVCLCSSVLMDLPSCSDGGLLGIRICRRRRTGRTEKEVRGEEGTCEESHDDQGRCEGSSEESTCQEEQEGGGTALI